ncbi:MAG: LysE family translocator [Pseudomonadota bacterium]
MILALGIFAAGFVSIGPNILAIIGTSMERGRRDGMRLALGVGTGSAVWACLTVAGTTALLTTYAGMLTVLKIVGAAYLLWLAYKAFRSAASADPDLKTRSAKGKNLFFQGMAVQLTNPKAALQWIAIVGLGLGDQSPFWVGVALIAIATMLSLLVHSAYALAFSTPPVISGYRRARRWIDGCLGLFFVFASFKVATLRN